MKTFSKLVFWAAITMTIAIVSCGKDDDAPATSIVDNNLSATVSNVDPSIEVVKLLVDCELEMNWVLDEETGENKLVTTVMGGQIIASGSYAGGKLTMNLPATVSDEYLEPIFEDDEVPAGVSVSNLNTKGIGGFLVGYDKDNNAIGWFFYGKLDYEKEEAVIAALAYVDSDAIVTGKTTNNDVFKVTATFDYNLKKGWNFMYVLFSGDEKDGLVIRTTTSNPGGMKWVFLKY